MPALPPDLVLGPLLRRIEGDRATVWVETGRPATVEVRATNCDAYGVARTFSAYGHHYALVVVEGLPPGSATPYNVFIDDVPVWPVPDDPFPPPTICTPVEGAPVRLVFGSCREASPYSVKRYPPDALDAYSVRLAASATAGVDGAAGPRDAALDWPDLLMLLGDQVYADETPEK